MDQSWSASATTLVVPKAEQIEQAKPKSPESTGPEIMIGLVGPAGVDFGQLVQILEEVLSSVHYSCREIRLSELLHDIEKWRDLEKPMFEDERIHAHMDAGNEF